MKNKQSIKCWRRSLARGLTLIEVVAAIAILGTLLTGVVLAKSRHTRQLHRARAQAVAVQAADALLAGWWSHRDGVPIGEAGVVSSDEALRWRTRLVENAPVAELGARVVRVEVYSGRQSVYRLTEDKALVVVDLVVPDPEVEAREAEEAEQEAQAERQAREASDA